MLILKEFALRYWKEILLIILSVFIFIKGRLDYSSLYKLHTEAISQYEMRIEEMNEAHKERLERKDEAIRAYIQRVEDIRLQYDNAKEEVETIRNAKKKEYKRKLIEKPEELIKEIENKFGLEYVE